METGNLKEAWLYIAIAHTFIYPLFAVSANFLGVRKIFKKDSSIEDVAAVLVLTILASIFWFVVDTVLVMYYVYSGWWNLLVDAFFMSENKENIEEQEKTEVKENWSAINELSISGSKESKKKSVSPGKPKGKVIQVNLPPDMTKQPPESMEDFS